MTPIPRIIHQMWRDDALPERLVHFRETWIGHHPSWENRLWTDRSLRELVAKEYPDFLEIYDAYPNPIMRADAARYLLLDHFGGVYADLDMECLRPMDSLLEGERLLIPLEPEAHNAAKVATDHGMRRIVGNAWLASVPGHSFWGLVREEMVRRRADPGPLTATGPFLLTDLVDRCEEPEKTPRLLRSETVYPVTNLDFEWLQAREAGGPHRFGPDTYAIHYWDGTWWKKPWKRTKLHLLKGAAPVLSGWLDDEKAAAGADRAGFNPLVSCLMVTGNRPELAALAIEAFRRQTYRHRELVIIDDSGNDLLGRGLEEGAQDIRWIQVPPEGKPLGALRNLALAEARGDLLCQWDDDDLSAPTRLERQVRVFFTTGADACGLYRLHLWWPERDWIAITSSRLWECALMWRRGAIAAYPEIRAGEDTPPVKALAVRGTVAVIEAPELYTYICHGKNTFASDHWLSLWAAASRKSTDAACRLKLQLMQEVLPCDEYLRTLGLPGLSESDGGTVSPPSPAATEVSLSPKPSVVVTSADLPRILVATPVKDAEPHLESFMDALCATGYPTEKLSLAFLESDSRDATAASVEQLLSRHASRFARTQLLRRNFGFHLNVERWEVPVQRQRREILARSRNLLVEQALSDEDWVLWIDADVVSWPRDIIHRLLGTGHSIVTPHCVREPGGSSYDLNTFVFRDPQARDGDEHLVDGIYQPPRGETRRYLDSYRDRDEVEVDAVGGTMLLVNAGLHRGGLRFPALPYHGFLETEGLGLMARDFGVTCWGLPKIEIIHL